MTRFVWFAMRSMVWICWTRSSAESLVRNAATRDWVVPA
jgi:hypothetical protein